MQETVWRPGRPVDPVRTLAPLARGHQDPTHRVLAGSVWRTTITPLGPSTYRVFRQGVEEIACQAWGSGAAWVLASLPALLGENDDPETFEPRHPLLVAAHRRHPWLRITRTNRVLEALVPAVLEQKVTGKQATSAFQTLVRRFGSAAPGPAPEGMRLPPSPEQWRAIPSWEWHRAGVEPTRSKTIISACHVAAQLEKATDLPPDEALQRLRVVPGVGEWTASEVAHRALGDADAVSVGDYHLSAFVGWALLGRPIDDPEMVELLEQWRPHRQRVVRLLELSGASKPKFGPRLTIADHRRI